MADPVSITSLALSIASKATEALNALRERAQRSKDVDIKDQINTLYDHVLQLKEVISRLLDENKALKHELEGKSNPPETPKLRQVGEANYYFKGDEGPFCQPCYDDKHKLVALSPQKVLHGGSVIRRCLVCNRPFHEKRMSEPQAQIVPRVPKY